MIQSFALAALCNAAVAAGVLAEQVIPVPTGDNLTLPRPRVEYQAMPARYRRTGRKIGITKGGKGNPVQTVKRELYEVDLDMQVNVLAPDTKKDAAAAETWLERFTQAFVTAFPRGGNDAAGNYVRIRVQRAAYVRKSDPWLGDKPIHIFTRMNTVFVITFSGRITTETQNGLITTANINLPKMGKR